MSNKMHCDVCDKVISDWKRILVWEDGKKIHLTNSDVQMDVCDKCYEKICDYVEEIKNEKSI